MSCGVVYFSFATPPIQETHSLDKLRPISNAAILMELALNLASFLMMLSIGSSRPCFLTVFLLFRASIIRCPALR
jgi:hypothetical protein